MAAVRKKDIWICSAWQDRKKVTVHTCVSNYEKRDTAEAVSLWKTGTLES